MSRILPCLLLSTLGLILAVAVVRAQQPPQHPEGVEVQTRGPIHEAFAEPVDSQPAPTHVINRQPPAPIEEQPPDQRPEGDRVQWIGGYWAWDDARNDFLWVSGFWRTPPPGRTWVPGSWRDANGGFQWVSGYWARSRRPNNNTCRRRRHRSKPDPRFPLPASNTSMFLVAGTTTTTVTFGGQACGWNTTRVGFGFPRIIVGPRPAMSSSKATGTSRCANAACCSPRSTSALWSPIGRAGIIRRPSSCTTIRSTAPCSCAPAARTTTSATTSKPATQASATIPGSASASAARMLMTLCSATIASPTEATRTGSRRCVKCTWLGTPAICRGRR